MGTVWIQKLDQAAYPEFPFSPSKEYPELANRNINVDNSVENKIYDTIRFLLYQMGLDSENYGTENWNPMRSLIQKGEKVFLKPNLVFHKHPAGEKEVVSMITNAAVLRPVIDYILLATDGDVDIKIGDAPVQSGDFMEACRISGITDLKRYYDNLGIHIELVDLRMVRSVTNKMDIVSKRIEQRGIDKYQVVDLKNRSELIDKIDRVKRFEITDYGIGSVSRHHDMNKNEYVIPCEILEADLFINLPKLKTHRKAGLTCAMKNLVGINGDKTCLAHHTRGNKKNGGDEFSKGSIKVWCRVRLWTFLKTNWFGIQIGSLIKRIYKKTVWKGKSQKEYNMLHRPSEFTEGSWYGNDTIWRCVKDLNKIILYADRKGRMQDVHQRKYLCIVDGILAGEGEGPMEQTTKAFGVLMAGNNPVYIDYAASKLMCYDYRNIPCIENGFVNKWWNLVDAKPQEVCLKANKPLNEIAEYFIPTYGWQDKLKPYYN